MIAALAGTIPAKNSAIMTAVANTARVTRTRLTRMFGSRRFQSRGACELLAMEECDEGHGHDQSDQRDRRQRKDELGVGNMGEATDHDVLRVAGNRGG